MDANSRRLASVEKENSSLQRDLAVLQVVRGRAAALAGRRTEALRHLDEALAMLPAAQGGDFLVTHWHTEAPLWRARMRLADTEAGATAQALADADAALALMQATAPDPDNAARRWGLALAEGERARALAQLGRQAESAAARQAAAAAWAGPVPPIFGALVSAAGVTVPAR